MRLPGAGRVSELAELQWGIAQYTGWKKRRAKKKRV